MPGTTRLLAEHRENIRRIRTEEDAKGAEQRGGKSKLSESGVRDGALTLAEV